MMGQTFIRLIENHPRFELDLLFSSGRNAGKKFGEGIKNLHRGRISERISEMKLHEFYPTLLDRNDIDIVFSSLPGFLEKDLEKEAAEKGYPVFSNSATHRMDGDVPILIPEVNGDHINIVTSQPTYPDGFIVTNPNCATAGLAISMAPLIQFGPGRIFVSTYQALSGAGYPGPSSYTMLGNLVPHIDKEERKIEEETGKILGDMKGDKIVKKDFIIHPSCVRVPVRDGHLLSVSMDLKEDFDLDSVIDAFDNVRGIHGLHSSPVKPLIFLDDEDRPQPVLDSLYGEPVAGMSVCVGRLRRKRNVISFFALVNNTIRGGAGNAILSAELAVNKGLIGGGGD
jgi:aspartate-semialdehyde dehydrogenase